VAPVTVRLLKRVVAYLQAIDMLWQLGEKKRAVCKPITMPAGHI
jgi:hypothetical protein